jgi:hypothetical protein
MTINGQVVMNDKFFDKFVDIIGQTVMPTDDLSLHDRVLEKPILKNAAIYVASELSEKHSGEWKMANCTGTDEGFLYLETDQSIFIKEERSHADIPVVEAIVDGRTFGLISSLLGYGLLWYVANSQKRKIADAYGKAAKVVETALKAVVSYFLEGAGRVSITQDEYREIEVMNSVVIEFAKYKYVM